MRTKTLIIILLSTIVFANASDTNTSIECVVTQEVLFQPIGDDTGKEVLTAKKIFKHCEETLKVRGNCKEWRYESSSTEIPNAYGVGIEEYRSSESMGSALAAIEAVNRTNAIFNGVKGYCEQGTIGDYAWLENPMFWASVAMSVISAMGEDTKLDDVQADETVVQQRINATETNMQNTQNSIDDAAATLQASLNDAQALIDTGTATAAEIALAEMVVATAKTDLSYLQTQYTQLETSLGSAEAVKADLLADKEKILADQTGLQKFSGFINEGYSGCATTGALNLLSSALDLYEPSAECDPVDEFCGGEGDVKIDMSDPTMIQTLTIAEFEYLKLEKPDSIKALEVLDYGLDTGFVTVRILSTAEMINYETVDKDALEQVQEDARLLQFEIRAAVTTIGVAGCMGKNLYDIEFGNPPTSTGGDGGSSSDLASNTAVSVMKALVPAPYNMIASTVMNLATTWKKINSCGDEDDANEKGSRHVKAYRGIRFNTCHPTKLPEVVEKWPLFGGTMRTGYEYCCYDSPISKILMIQLKSQLGKGWTHCTDVTTNELSNASFRACTPQESNPAVNGGFQDGKSFRGKEGVDYDMKNSYQYQYRCMNLNELEDYIESQIPVDFSQSHVSEFIQDIRPDVRD